jgi:hypothetical protein
MNERCLVFDLRALMDSPEGWGRTQGREVYRRLLNVVEANAGVAVFKVSMKNVRRVDISFASETVIEIAHRYRGTKGFCLIDLDDSDLAENWEAAAMRKEQPILIWSKTGSARLAGPKPSPGNQEAYDFALERPQVRAAEFAEAKSGMAIANASMKFKQLWEQGYLLRRESAADSGGIEYKYYRIG